MKAIRSVIDDLVQRRLWPVALLLVIGIVAVPLVLGHKGGSASADAPPAAAAIGATTDVALATTDASATDTPASGRALKRMHRRDPFVPPAHETAKAVTTGAAPSGGGVAEAGSSSPSGGGGGGGGATSFPGDSGGTSGAPTSSAGGVPAPSTTTTTTTTTTTPAPVPTYAYTAVDVAFGRVSSGLTARHDVSRGSALPGPAAPLVVYLGLRAHSRAAVFVVSGDADPRGDGRCRPRPGDCQTLLMRAGETEFLSAGHALYRLDVRDVRAARTTSRAKARAAARRVPAARTARAAGAARWVRSADSVRTTPARPAPTGGS